MLAHLAWRAGNHTDVYMPEPRMPVGRLAKVSRHSPRTTFYPCQSIEDWAPNTAYARGVMITGPLKCPICQNGGSITRSLHGHFNQLASDVDTRLWLPWLPSFHATQHPFSGNIPSRGLQPWSASWMRSPPARLAVRLERFQACALRNGPTLHVPPESNEQATGQGHDPNRRMRLPPRAKRY